MKGEMEVSEQEKVIARIRKLKAQADSEEKLENFGAAELFREKVSEQLEKYSLSESDLELKENEKEPIFLNEFGKTIIANPFLRINAKTNLRMIWFEKLSQVIAEGYFCKTESRHLTGEISFYGRELGREIAIFMFLKIAEMANANCKLELIEEKKKIGLPPRINFKTKETINFPSIWMGDEVFVENFHSGFREAISEIYKKHESFLEKQKEVEEYWLENKYSDSNYQENYLSISNVPFNENAFEIGKKVGIRIATKASKNISSLTVKKPVLNSDLNTIFLILDRSGSMYGDKMRQAKAGAIEYAKKAVEKGYSIGLIQFDDNADLLIRPTNEVNGKFSKVVEKIEPRGSTDLKKALRLAQSHFISRKTKRTICVITDGLPNYPMEEHISVANELKRIGIEIMAIGTEPCNQEFLNRLSSKEGLGLLVDKSQLLLGIGQMAEKLQ